MRTAARFLPGALALATALALAACAVSPARRELAVEWYGVGNAWLDAGKWAEAGKAYDRALALDPGLLAATYNAARALVEAGSYDKALALADGLLASEKDNVRYIGLRAYALHKAGKAEDAALAYEEAWKLDPWVPDVAFNSALLLLEAGRASEAADRLSPLAVAKPDDDAVLALLARSLAEAGRDVEALAAFEDLRSLGKIDNPSLLRLGLLYETSGDYAKALEVLVEAAGTGGPAAPAWFAVARLRLSRTEDQEGGLEALAKALAAGFDDKAAALDLAGSLHLLARASVVSALVAKGLLEDGGPDTRAGTPGRSAGAAGTPAAAGRKP